MIHPVIEAIATAGESAQRVAGNLKRNRCFDRDDAWSLVEACGVDRFGVAAINDRLTMNDRHATAQAHRAAQDRQDWRTAATDYFLKFPFEIQRSAVVAIANGGGAAEAERIQTGADDRAAHILNGLRHMVRDSERKVAA